MTMTSDGSSTPPSSRRPPLAAILLLLLGPGAPRRASASASASSSSWGPTTRRRFSSFPFPADRTADASSTHRRRRRRNNTGFYYGIRDDDVVSLTSSPPRSATTPRFPSLPALGLGRRFSSDAAAGPTEAPEAEGSGEEGRFDGASSAGRPRGTRELRRLAHASAPTKPRPRRRKDASKRRGTNKRRRKNNTGFYYGIREDVLTTLPPPSKPPPPRTKRREGGADGRAPTAPPATKRAGDRLSPEPPANVLPTSPEPPSDEGRKAAPRKTRPPKPEKEKKQKQNPRSSSSSDVLLSEALAELRAVRDEIAALREELGAAKERARGTPGDDAAEGESLPPAPAPEKGQKGRRKRVEATTPDRDRSEPPAPTSEEEDEGPASREALAEARRARRRRLERIGRDVERWASEILSEEASSSENGRDGEDDDEGGGWKEMSCNKFCRRKFNGDGRTKVYLKWMPDTRDPRDIEPTSDRSVPYPCLRCHSTFDAPLADVCAFLADESSLHRYNELVVDHDDVEVISPGSKITWTKCPKILFVKPRDFVTYCCHRWRRDGTQVLVNQACEHEDRPGVLVEGQGDVCRGYALRGANFISRDPDDPNKTRITVVSHANPGGGLPQWAMNTAVNGVVQVEPFKFFYNINEGVCERLREEGQRPSMHPTTSAAKRGLSGRSDRPAGIAHLGFTCFWPNGGGLEEARDDSAFANLPQQEAWEDLEEEQDADDVPEGA